MNKQEMQAKAREMQAKAKDGVSRMTNALPPEVRQRVSNKNIWLRFLLVFVLFVVVALFLLDLLLWVTGLLLLAQFFFMLFTGSTNTTLNNINGGLARYVGQVWEYLLFCSDRFPIPDWVRNFSSSGSASAPAQPTPRPVEPETYPASVTSNDVEIKEAPSQDTQPDFQDGQNRNI